jgi:hypothetical protein
MWRSVVGGKMQAKSELLGLSDVLVGGRTGEGGVV